MSRKPIREQEICWEQVLEIEGTKTSNFTRKISRAGLKTLANTVRRKISRAGLKNLGNS
jgi:hypothetical protein